MLAKGPHCLPQATAVEILVEEDDVDVSGHDHVSADSQVFARMAEVKLVLMIWHGPSATNTGHQSTTLKVRE